MRRRKSEPRPQRMGATGSSSARDTTELRLHARAGKLPVWHQRHLGGSDTCDYSIPAPKLPSSSRAATGVLAS